MVKIYIIIFLFLTGCVRPNDSLHSANNTQEHSIDKNEELIFSDEFNYTGLPDPKKWVFDRGTGPNGWGNWEIQYYTYKDCKKGKTKGTGTRKSPPKFKPFRKYKSFTLKQAGWKIDIYLKQGTLGGHIINRGVTWIDAGTPDSLLEASQLISFIEKRTGRKVGCPHEVALNKGFVTRSQFAKNVQNIPSSPYKEYLVSLI